MIPAPMISGILMLSFMFLPFLQDLFKQAEQCLPIRENGKLPRKTREYGMMDSPKKWEILPIRYLTKLAQRP